MSRSSKEKAVDRTPRYSPQEEEEDYNEEDYEDSVNWKHVDDPSERRKIQNRLAQRKFREKTKMAKEESIRHSQNQAAARNAYSHPDPRDLEHGNNHSGPPWGSLSMRHIVGKGKAREQSNYAQSQQQQSRDESVYYEHDPRGGGRTTSVSQYGGDRGGRETSFYSSDPRGGYHDVRGGSREGLRGHYVPGQPRGGRGSDTR